MTTMTKLLISVLAVFGIALGTAASASADEADFIDAITSLHYYAVDCAGCARDAVDVGHKVCSAFASGGKSAAIQAVLTAYNGPGQENPEYYATLFAQYAAHDLCPNYDGQIGPI
jgi:hypothetical protein